VAPGVRFKALAIFVTPFQSLAIDFIKRRSSFVHTRRICFFFFLAIVAPVVGTTFYHISFCQSQGGVSRDFQTPTF